MAGDEPTPLRQLSITPRFQKDLAQLDDKTKQSVFIALRKFMFEPKNSGLNFEKLSGLNELYSIRISQGSRIILRKVDKVYEVARVGKHEIYRKLK